MVLLSLIIPTFNSSASLPAAIDSIVNQTFKNYELWIIDGNSSDDTVDIIKTYQARYKQIHFISEPDKGTYDALNKGVKLSSGEWIYFLGSDNHLVGDDILD